MAGRWLDLVGLACLLCLGASLRLEERALPGPAAAKPAPRQSAFPPPPVETPLPAPLQESVARRAPALTGDAEVVIARIASWATADVDPLRRAFAGSTDLYAFMQRHVHAARAGDGASAYYVYLALDECRPYLRLLPEEARELLERVPPSAHGSMVEERQSWLRDSQRCYRFAGGDLSTVREALGAEEPGAAAEYGSVLFERAADAGFAPALAERALREPGFDRETRESMLRAALSSGNADVYWQLFHRDWLARGDDERTARSLAFLIEACRNGYDCGSQAPWFRAGECADGTEQCLPGQTALAHYWYSASPFARDAAFALAQRIGESVVRERWDEVPLIEPERQMNAPDAAGLDIAALPD